MVQPAFSQIRGGLEQLLLFAETAEQRLYVLDLYRSATRTASQYGQIGLARQLRQEGQNSVTKVFSKPPEPTDSPYRQALFKYFTQDLDITKLYPQLVAPIPEVIRPPVTSVLKRTVQPEQPHGNRPGSVTNGPNVFGYLRMLVRESIEGDISRTNAVMIYLVNHRNELPAGTLQQEEVGIRQWRYMMARRENILQMINVYQERNLHPPPLPGGSTVKQYDPSETYAKDHFRPGDSIVTQAGTRLKVEKVAQVGPGQMSLTYLNPSGKERGLFVKTA